MNTYRVTLTYEYQTKIVAGVPTFTRVKHVDAHDLNELYRIVHEMFPGATLVGPSCITQIDYKE